MDKSDFTSLLWWKNLLREQSSCGYLSAARCFEILYFSSHYLTDTELLDFTKFIIDFFPNCQ